MIVSEPSTDLVITCMHCGYNIRDAKNIFHGCCTSYICPNCRYEGYAYKSNTKIISHSFEDARHTKNNLSIQKIKKKNNDMHINCVSLPRRNTE